MKAARQAVSLEKKQSRYGYIFVIPVIIGLALIYIPVLIQSFMYSMSDISMGSQGFSLQFTGFNHYYKALFVDPNYRRAVIDSIQRMFIDVPIIIIFSFFMANVLNQKFFGRVASRVIFFLPVVIATGIISAVDASDMILGMYRSGGKLDTGIAAGGNIFNYMELRNMLMSSYYNKTFIHIILGAIDGLYNIVTTSGVQMLIFLAGLQSIPVSMYEAARVEGATSWEMFWKISFPIISPLILVNVIYSIIDNFLSYRNGVINIIRGTMAQADLYEFAAALSWIYLGVVAVILVVVWLVVGRMVIYQD